MSFIIRPFSPDDADYATLAWIRTSIYPDNPLTAREIQHGDEYREAKIIVQRWIGEVGGRPVAYASFMHMSWNYHPHKFGVNVMVHPDHEQQGYGSALYHNLLLALAEHDPIMLRAGVREDKERGMRFATRCGFREEMREWESWLDVAHFDASRFAGALDRVRAQGIVIRPLSELAGDPQSSRKLYDLQNDLMHDVPLTEPFTPQPFEVWERERLSDPNYLPAGHFVALANGEYVGVSALWRRQGSDHLSTGLTGVRREWRRKGIALALKLHAIAYAQSQGVPRISTGNASTNQGMLSINQDLGFVRRPAWIQMLRYIKEKT